MNRLGRAVRVSLAVAAIVAAVVGLCLILEGARGSLGISVEKRPFMTIGNRLAPVSLCAPGKSESR